MSKTSGQLLKYYFREIIHKIHFQKIDNPVFIIGTGRCGSSLMVRILNSHDNLVGYPGEANDLWHPNSYPFAKRTIDTPAFMEDPVIFTKLSVENWPKGHAEYIRSRFKSFHFQKNNNKILFIKSAMISFMIPEILSLFPKSRFIHVYRFGPSVVESFTKKEWPKYHSYFNSMDQLRLNFSNYWNTCLTNIFEAKNKHDLDSKFFLEFSYEALCEQSQETLIEIAKFLEVSPEGFKFDLELIKSQNFKAPDYTSTPHLQECYNLMIPGLKAKKYIF